MTRSMISTLFIIRKNKAVKNGEVPIYLRLTSSRQSVEVAIGRRIQPELWSSEFGGARGNTKEARDVNEHIAHIRNQLKDVMRKLRENDKEITPLSIKNEWLGIVPDERTVITVFREHNARVRQLVGKDFADGTRQRYETTCKHVQEFIGWKFKKNDLPLSAINMNKNLCPPAAQKA